MTAAVLEPMALAPGSRIGKFELVRVIGEGGMGAVWVARNSATGGDVAIKILWPKRGADIQAEARLRYEAQLGATLNHRNITRVFDLVETPDGALALVMELLRGETLASAYKKRGALPTKEAVAIIVPLLSALQHAHDLGVVHRDLKPTNIFLHVDPDGHVTPKLLDFGIAKAEESSIETRTGDALGTPQYMSPEQVRAIPLDGRSDLFGIAVVLYEVITGQNPFRGPTSTAVLAQVLESEIDPDPAIDPRVWIELRRAFSKQAYERHASAKELAAALCAAVGDTETALSSSLKAAPPMETPRRAPGPPTPARSSPQFEPQLLDFPRPASELPPSMGTPAPWVKPRAPLRTVIVVLSLVFALGLLIGVGVLIRRPTPADRTPPPASATVASATTAATPTTNIPPPEPITTTAATTPSAHESATPTAPPTPKTSPRRPPPTPTGATTGKVGRTPGF